MPGTATGTNRSHFRQAARKNVIADNPHGSCMPGDESLPQPDVRWRRKYVRGSSLPGGVDLTDDSHSREWRRGAWMGEVKGHKPYARSGNGNQQVVFSTGGSQKCDS